jgi:DNA-binding protein HU-beta
MEEEGMTKADLVSKIAERTGLTRVAGEKALNAFFDAAKDTLLSEGKLNLAGFGVFAVMTRQARTGRNPLTGETISIPEGKVVKFRPGKQLKDKVR